MPRIKNLLQYFNVTNVLDIAPSLIDSNRREVAEHRQIKHGIQEIKWTNNQKNFQQLLSTLERSSSYFRWHLPPLLPQFTIFWPQWYCDSYFLRSSYGWILLVIYFTTQVFPAQGGLPQLLHVHCSQFYCASSVC